MPTKLQLFNGAMVALGHERCADTGEARAGPRELVECYDQVVGECLAEGHWNFAMETIKATADTGVTPEFGYPEVFAKPSDWIRTSGVSVDENFAFPLTRYYDDANFWSAESSPIYIRYVSNDTGLGLELNRWPRHFTRFVELELAARVCLRVTQSESLLDKIEKIRDKAKAKALNHDAMNEPNPRFPPPGSWTTARGGTASRERGSNGSLTG